MNKKYILALLAVVGIIALCLWLPGLFDQTIDAPENERIDILNSFDDVAEYIRQNGRLPANYITKAQATAAGWVASEGNLAEVAPGKSIGGDIYRNAEGALPAAPGRIWYEADINYTSGFRGSDRILYSNDGLIYGTTDHYATFIVIKPEDI
ncbi:MAG: hypothetical protein FWF88_00975 [Peptococcaceae bacterium]|nr:hypothetical protein [Peptococcaceae bacterium]